MKIYFSIAVFLYVTLLWCSGTASAADKCYQCDGKLSECPKNSTVECKEVTNAVTPAVHGPDSKPGGKPPEGEKQEIPPAPGDNPAAPLLEREAAKKFKCLTVTGKEGESSDVLAWKGCATGCDDPSLKKFTKEHECVACETDSCNPSVLIKPIGWISILIAIFCVALEY